jgi:hypothetical protein
VIVGVDVGARVSAAPHAILEVIPHAATKTPVRHRKKPTSMRLYQL